MPGAIEKEGLPHEHKLSESGFSLVEMLLVLAIMALASGLVLARGHAQDSTVAQTRLQHYFLEARTLAMAEGRTVRITLDPGAARLVGPPGLGALDLDGKAHLEAVGSAIIFHPDGSSAGGRLRIAGRNGAQQGVAISPLAGSVFPLP